MVPVVFQAIEEAWRRSIDAHRAPPNIRFYRTELKTLDAMLERLATQHGRRLRERFGVGPPPADVLVAVAGDNPERLKSEAALAALCGASRLQASSGKTI